MTRCEKCGHDIVPGEWPFCPHPVSKGVHMAPDEIVGGVTLENWGPNPVTFYSYSEMRRYAAEHNITIRETFAPAPGTDIDPCGIPNPKGYIDATTLENARVLTSRISKPTEEDIEMQVRMFQGEMEGTTLAEVLAGDLKAQSRLHRRTTGNG